jgi:gas vesicle protein
MNEFDERDGVGPTTVFVAGLCAGAMIGACLGLLFAPSAGFRLRARLARSTRRAVRTVGDVVDRGVDSYERARDAVSHAGDEVERVVGRVSDQIDKGLHSATELISAVRTRS